MKKKLLLIEMLLLYFGFPLLFPFGVLPKHPIPFILLSALVMFFLLRASGSFELNSFVFIPKGSLKRITFPLLITSLFFYFLVLFIQPDKLFYFPSTKPIFWMIVMLLYPILSAYPQEIIFRVFFFHRYQSLFKNENIKIIASSLAFGLAHLMFGSWISVVLSVLGGILFSKTYLKTNSLMTAAIEHSLYGQLIFTIGLGNYFYHR